MTTQRINISENRREKCPYCGYTENEKGDKRCQKCGKKLDDNEDKREHVHINYY